MKAMAWLTAILALTFAGAPFVTEPFTGFRADQLPIPQENPPIQPAGYAFSIWGVIYLWLVVSCLYGAVKRPNDAEWHKTRPWLIISLAVGTAWLAIANASVLWATITIWIMLATALAALFASPAKDRLLLRAPVGLYAGWLSAASFVSLAAFLAGNGLITDAYGWALILIPAALLLAAIVQITQTKAPEYGIAVAWALVAITVRNGQDVLTIAALAAACAAIMAALALRSARQAA
ncbi:MAG: hypothetical protein AAGA15_03595 [Pseudomonadota bacterium]